MDSRRDRETFAALLRDLPPAVEPISEEVILLDPDGRSLPIPQRITARAARPWIKRAGVPLGLWPCGQEIHWIPAADRDAFAERLRHVEGKDCNPDGDLLLFTVPPNRHVLVFEDLA